MNDIVTELISNVGHHWSIIHRGVVLFVCNVEACSSPGKQGCPPMHASGNNVRRVCMSLFVELIWKS